MLKDFCNTIKDNDTIWVIGNIENSDNIFSKFVTDKLFSSTYVIVSKSIAYVFVHKLDEGNIKVLDKDSCKIFIYESNLYKLIEQALRELNFPKRILLSYSTMADHSIDIISHSLYLSITNRLREIYKKYNKKFRVGSSQMNIYEIISKYNNIEIERLKVLASITDEILKKSFNNIKIGDSEIDISNNTIKITNEYMNKIKEKYDIIDYSMAWDICPIVLIGDNLKKGGHALPSNKCISKGDTIYFDFGIKAIYKDNLTLYTDMQRMGYFLKDDENTAPESVEKVFNTLLTSITNGIKLMKPGVRAYIVDEAVRNEILKNNYPDYPHATGHPVGRDVHGAGAIISYKTGKRARLSLVEGGIYTLEPRINIANGGSIEEMILVTKYGGIPLCKRQESLYLIKEKR